MTGMRIHTGEIGSVAGMPQALGLDGMRAHAMQAVSMLKLLGNEDRLMLLCQLAVQEHTVSELEQLTGITQPTLSQQLGVLRREGLVSTRREGKFIWYQLADSRALQLMQLVHQLFCGPAAHESQA
jgi:DNA-binding transcriptional ArsR family regulator